jgi:aryl-alcohol dehydrogenase-like predicted oxidoreductase
MALAWVLGRKPWIVPIPGTTKLHRLEENIGAVSIRISPQEMARIEAACDRIGVVGARYPDSLEQLTGI